MDFSICGSDLFSCLDTVLLSSVQQIDRYFYFPADGVIALVFAFSYLQHLCLWDHSSGIALAKDSDAYLLTSVKELPPVH